MCGNNNKLFYIYLDEIIISSMDSDSHLEHVENILSALHRANITIKIHKCAVLRKKSDVSAIWLNTDVFHVIHHGEGTERGFIATNYAGT